MINNNDCDTDNGRRTATVEALTATVKVIKVGPRDVTSGIYDQLDAVPHDKIILFGRVRPLGTDDSALYVIGKHIMVGDLVRSVCPYPDGPFTWNECRPRRASPWPEDEDEDAELWRQHEHYRENWASIPYDQRFWKNKEAWEWNTAQRARYLEWSVLLLIVLAGLR